jgi:hypothetical protein
MWTSNESRVKLHRPAMGGICVMSPHMLAAPAASSESVMPSHQGLTLVHF